MYWRGTTIKTGASFTGHSGDREFTGEFDVSHSAADALNGRNLFPGGGTVSAVVSGNGPVREDSETAWDFFGFFFRPISTVRPDQPNRLIPVGNFMGVHTSLSAPIGSLLFWPSVEIMREASHTESQTAITTDRVDGDGWTLNLGATLALPAGRHLDLIPCAGYVFGSVGAVFRSTTTIGPSLTSTDSFRDRIRGWWTSFELSARF